MTYLAAPTLLRIAPGDLAARTRERFGGELRRAGGFAQLSLLGAQACLDTAPGRASLGVLWASRHGALAAARTALQEMASGEPVMPFSFVATQPHLAATLLAQRSAPVARAAFVYIESSGWPRLLSLAQAWLASCEQVLVGWVEEAAEEEAHQSDWCVLQRSPAGVACEPLREARGALPATSADWLARVAAWSAAPRETLALRGGGGEAWRFAAGR